MEEDKQAGQASREDQCSIRLIHQDRIEQARAKALPAETEGQLARLFKTLGDRNRLKILWALRSGEMCVCDLAAFLGVSESAVSHQLRMLRQTGLVENRREGPVLYYRITGTLVSALVETALQSEE